MVSKISRLWKRAAAGLRGRLTTTISRADQEIGDQKWVDVEKGYRGYDKYSLLGIIIDKKKIPTNNTHPFNQYKYWVEYDLRKNV